MSHPSATLLVLHCGALGDAVLAAQTALSLANSLGIGSVNMVARSGIIQWMKEHRLLKYAFRLDAPPWNALFHPEKGELVIDEAGSTFPIVSFLGGPTTASSLRLQESTAVPPICIDPRPSQATITQGTHITDQWLAEISQNRLLPTSCRVHSPEIARIPQSMRLHERLEIPIDQRILLCHPGSGSAAKCCPIEFLRILVERARRTAFRPAWIVGPDEIERGDEFLKVLDRTAPVIFEEDMSAAAELVADADGYVGNDAGMTHVAALTGRATVAIFGPTDPRVWRPIGTRVRIERFPDGREPLEHWCDHILHWLGNQATWDGRTSS